MKTTAIAAFLAIVGASVFHPNLLWKDGYRRSLEDGSETSVSASHASLEIYTIDDIMATFPYVESSHPQLLVWDGSEFASYNLLRPSSKSKVSWRYLTIIPLVVHALSTEFPGRFEPGSPPFQILWTVDDYIGGRCINEDVDCPSDTFAPIVVFGSTPRNKELLPTAKGFPNPYFVGCLYHWQIDGASTCQWGKVNEDVSYDDLEKKVIWRGSDFLNFLSDYRPKSRPKGDIMSLFKRSDYDKLDQEGIIQCLFDNSLRITPRWVAMAHSLRARLNNENWIDIMFTNTGGYTEGLHESFEKKNLSVTGEQISAYNMSSKYAYQLDLAGGGGTTWDGTLTKLLMKGVLFHHETKFQDWFYDEMTPWIHYIPVNMMLTNLQDHYEWAQEHPEKCQEISERGTDFAKYLLSEKYMSKIWKELFVDYLGDKVQSFDSQGMDWDAMVKRYTAQGFQLVKVANCDNVNCHTQVEANKTIDWFTHRAHGVAT
jgi:hypothetical protein